MDDFFKEMEFVVKCSYNELTGVIPDEIIQPIIRCHDCKYYEYWEFRDGRTAHDCARGGEYLFDTEPNGFCKWGEERKDV